MRLINAAYHQQITNQFRALIAYGTTKGVSAQRAAAAVKSVDNVLPIPPSAPYR